MLNMITRAFCCPRLSCLYLLVLSMRRFEFLQTRVCLCPPSLLHGVHFQKPFLMSIVLLGLQPPLTTVNPTRREEKLCIEGRPVSLASIFFFIGRSRYKTNKTAREQTTGFLTFLWSQFRRDSEPQIWQISSPVDVEKNGNHSRWQLAM